MFFLLKDINLKLRTVIARVEFILAQKINGLSEIQLIF